VLLTGQRMDANQGLDSVPADEWRALRQELASDGSALGAQAGERLGAGRDGIAGSRAGRRNAAAAPINTEPAPTAAACALQRADPCDRAAQGTVSDQLRASLPERLPYSRAVCRLGIDGLDGFYERCTLCIMNIIINLE
jgi:hypothetical protein